jgi:hypothetical protein
MAKPNKITAEAMDKALDDQRQMVFQAMGIIKIAGIATGGGSMTDGSMNAEDLADLWSALEGVYAILDGVAEKLESTEILLARKLAGRQLNYGKAREVLP